MAVLRKVATCLSSKQLLSCLGSSFYFSIRHDFFTHTKRKACLTPWHSFSTSPAQRGLEEFFDEKDTIEEENIKVGRPWRKDELRLKSNTDLHKLWYVLLKERNMLMTMEDEYKRNCELLPSPERFDKVEESMENLIEVIQERDKAVNLLEVGETGEQGSRWTYNELGLGYWKKNREHYIPLHMNSNYRNRVALNGKWQHRYKVLYREKLLNKNFSKMKYEEKKKKELLDIFPYADID